MQRQVLLISLISCFLLLYFHQGIFKLSVGRPVNTEQVDPSAAVLLEPCPSGYPLADAEETPFGGSGPGGSGNSPPGSVAGSVAGGPLNQAWEFVTNPMKVSAHMWSQVM